jgi:lipoyl(octanoyl) transferase
MTDGLILPVRRLGQISYDAAYAIQEAAVCEQLALRSDKGKTRQIGQILVVEHVPPVITISRRPGASSHLLAPLHVLDQQGIEVKETDRGGDITYHGPGQLVLYPIIDLPACGLGLHPYMRLLEEAVIMLCQGLGLPAVRDADATGVWVNQRKVCAMGVRVRKWITMHGLALNITTNLHHFDYIVPCGLAGRGVTSLASLTSGRCPTFEAVAERLCDNIIKLVLGAAQQSVPAQTCDTSAAPPAPT